MPENSQMLSKIGGKRPGSGRKPYEPSPEDRQLVHDWKGRGVSDEDIAIKLDINLTTLKKYYKRELNLGRVEANALIGGAIFRSAMNGNFPAQKWWSQVRMGWKDVQHVDLISSDGSMSALEEGKEVMEIMKRKWKK